MSEVNPVALEQMLLPKQANCLHIPTQFLILGSYYCEWKRASHISHTYRSSLHRCRRHSQPGHRIFWNLGRTVLSDTWSGLANILSKSSALQRRQPASWVSIESGQVLKIEQVTTQLKLPEFAWLSSLCPSPCLSCILGTISQSTWCPCFAITRYLSKWTPNGGLSLKSLVQSMIPASQRF